MGGFTGLDFPTFSGKGKHLPLSKRLVRKLCETCKRPVRNLNHASLLKAGFREDEIPGITLFEPVGCASCVGGFKGRRAIHETLYISPEIRDIIINSGEKIQADAIVAAAVKHGMRTLRQSGLDVAKQGGSSLDEVIGATILE